MPNKHRSHAGKFTRSVLLSAGDIRRGGVSLGRFIKGGKALQARARREGQADALKRAGESHCRIVRVEPGHPPPFGRGYVNRKGWRMHLSYLGRDFEVPAVAVAFWGDSAHAAARWLDGFRLRRLCGKAGCLEPAHFYEYHPEMQRLEEDSHMTPKLIHQLFATAAERGEAEVAFRKRGSAMHARFQLYAWRKKHRERNGLEEGLGPWDGVQVSIREEGERWVVRLEQDETEVLCELVDVEPLQKEPLEVPQISIAAPEITLEEAERLRKLVQERRANAPGDEPLGAPQLEGQDPYIRAFIESTSSQAHRDGSKSENAQPDAQPDSPELKSIEKDGIVWQPSTSGLRGRPPQTEAERQALEEYKRTGRSRAVPLRPSEAEEEQEQGQGQEQDQGQGT